jgi:hypothetical protein
MLLDCTAGPQLLPERLMIGVDTEYHDAHTLTVQPAARLDLETLVVQIYRDRTVPDLPADFSLDRYLSLTEDKYGLFCKRILLRPVQPLTSDLSPGRMALDLLGLPGRVLSRAAGRAAIGRFSPVVGPGLGYPPNVIHDARRDRWVIPPVHLTLVGHFLRADFARLFGREFLDGLRLAGAEGGGRIGIESRKLLRFVLMRGRWRESAPVLQYVSSEDNFFAVRLETRDSHVPFGPSSLDRHSKTFLGLPKSDIFTEEDKEDMHRAFLSRKADAFGYAATDVVQTLLVFEQMEEKDREIYRAFGFAEKDIPPMRAFQGGRVSTFLLATTRAGVAAGSQALASDRQLRRLMRGGGSARFVECLDASKFGAQAGTVHGGLLLSRSPTRLWHEAPGQLADVDLSACYSEITAGINVYWGRPVVLEPGGKRLTLAQAVALVRRLADDDAWMVWASGPIAGYKNVLIPSTQDALTAANFVARQGRARRRRAARQASPGEGDDEPGPARGTTGARPYAARVDFGVITHATWVVIQAMPPEVRRQYAGLNADCILFYARALAADSGPQYDELVARHMPGALPWEATLDPEATEIIQRQKIGADYVTLRYPLGHFARRIGQFRRDAQASQGKGSGLDLAFKVHANALYGVLASPYHPVHNVLAANVITGTGRALAWAMSQALNGIQVITDGVTYRRDQVPSCTYAECLRRKPDYPLSRAEAGDGIPFLGPAGIPMDRGRFTAWYREHLRRFFGLSGRDADDLFAIHQLEHKTIERTKAVTFDGLGCDGAGNYLKATVDGTGTWGAQECKARSYGPRSKEALQDWLLRTYRTGTLVELPPLAEDRELLSLDRAAQRARAALEQGPQEVYLPLGLAHTKVLNYKIVKASAFVYENAEQRAALVRQIQRFEERGCGLEVLALRRSYGDRHQGSVEDVLKAIHAAVRAGRRNLTTVLNLNKLTGPVTEVAEQRRAEVARRKDEAERRLRERLDAPRLEPEAYPTALQVTADDLATFKGRDRVLELKPRPFTWAELVKVPGPVPSP